MDLAVPTTVPPRSPTLAWIDATMAASGYGVDEAPAQTESTLPSASKTQAPRAPQPPMRIVGAWEPAPPPTRYVRVYDETGVCTLFVEGSAEDPYRQV